MTYQCLKLVPACSFVRDIEEDLSPSTRTALDRHLRALEALTTIRGSYEFPTGRAVVKDFLAASGPCWRGPAARVIKGHLRANLASGRSIVGMVTLLGDHIDGLPPEYIVMPCE